MDGTLPTGVYPASVTPLTLEGMIDTASVVKLMAYFEAAGCRGVVLAGTNGEGPSLSAYEKRDLLRTAAKARGRLRLVLGVATPSLDEAVWLCSQAGRNGADAALVMPPGYFRAASEAGIEAWFSRVLDASPVPIVVYNFPKMTGFALSPGLVTRLGRHPMTLGLKDSSGDRGNLRSYRSALEHGKVLFVGDETLLPESLESGWTGAISGAANVLHQWLCKVVNCWVEGDKAGAKTAFSLLEPVLQAVRGARQPATNKAVLHALGVIGTPALLPPLETADPTAVLAELQSRLGVGPGELGVAGPAAVEAV